MLDLHTALAIVAVLFGVFKLVVGSLVLLLPGEAIAKSWVLRLIAGSDETVAGKGMDAVIMAYGLYSLLHGLAYFGIALAVTAFAVGRGPQIWVHFLLGAVSVLFYALVLYTKVGIPKSDTPGHRARYILGLDNGYMFIAMALLFRLHHIAKDVAWDWGAIVADTEAVVLVSGTTVLSAMIVYDIVNIYRNRSKVPTFSSDVATLALIPALT